MVISLDYDKTFTLDPPLWMAFMRSAEAAGHQLICLTMRHLRSAEAAGHQLICLTMRHPHEPIEMPCQVIYTCRKAKLPYAVELGIRVDVWIDDAPQWLINDSP